MIAELLSALAIVANWLSEWVVILAIWFVGVFSIAASVLVYPPITREPGRQNADQSDPTDGPPNSN